jgi:predicted transcriptional regulator
MDELDLVIRKAFEESRVHLTPQNLDLDHVLSCLSNPIRRDIIKLLHRGTAMGLMQISRNLNIDDHTKVSFHLKLLKKSGLIDKHPKRTYNLTKNGLNTIDYLKMFERSLS